MKKRCHDNCRLVSSKLYSFISTEFDSFMSFIFIAMKFCCYFIQFIFLYCIINLIVTFFIIVDCWKNNLTVIYIMDWLFYYWSKSSLMDRPSHVLTLILVGN